MASTVESLVLAAEIYP